MIKNQQYITTKSDKIISEIKLITDQETKTIILTSGIISKEDALNLKIFQYNIINYIKKNPVYKLEHKLRKLLKKLCPECKEGLAKQERCCEKDLYNFVSYCMLNKSLVN